MSARPFFVSLSAIVIAAAAAQASFADSGRPFVVLTPEPLGTPLPGPTRRPAVPMEARTPEPVLSAAPAATVTPVATPTPRALVYQRPTPVLPDARLPEPVSAETLWRLRPPVPLPTASPATAASATVRPSTGSDRQVVFNVVLPGMGAQGEPGIVYRVDNGAPIYAPAAAA
jgi:hypothetical protein